MSESPDSIEFRNYPPLGSDEEYKFEVLNSGQLTATAHVQSKQDEQGKFWHLEDLLVIEKENRSLDYGTKLLNHLRQYLWSIDKLRIRVHPANGQQAIEELSEIKHNQEKYSEEELDAMDREQIQAMQQPDFWEKQAETSENIDSKRLFEWYRNRRFTDDDPDGKHLWCYPD